MGIVQKPGFSKKPGFFVLKRCLDSLTRGEYDARNRRIGRSNSCEEECMKRHLSFCLAALGLWLAAARSAEAVIQVEQPLRQMIFGATEFIFVAKVSRFDAERPTMVLAPSEHLKAKAPFERLPINLKATGEQKYAADLLKRLADDLALVVFVSKSSDGKYNAMAYSNGTWFSLIGYIDGDSVRWAMLQVEPNFRRTFRGTTDELTSVVKLAVARKKAPPPIDEKAAPGLGPEIGEKSKDSSAKKE
jgi:hypothetical protein